MYEQYLIRLLAPLSLYNLRAPHNGGELAALGGELDSVSGLVELVERESLLATAESEGLDRADMALAGIRSAVPPDEVIMAMKDVGDKMDVSLRETGLGGIAGTPSGVKIADELRLAYGHLNG